MMRVAALLAGLLLLALPSRARAESPLERRVSLRVRDVALREALDRIAALARIRISYSGDVVPLERRVSLARDSATVGELLQEVLRGIPARPVIIGDDHVVLAPRATPDSARAPPPVLEQVVITGSVLGAPERALAVALDVVPGRASERRDEAALSSILDAAVPGIWLFEQSPTTMSARYGSIRGASSFGVSFPKVYLDGIEVANPLLLTRVEAAQVQRVEVIRGPQGAALYGADAISGVVNIVSRQEAPPGARGTVRTRMGWMSSAYAGATPLQEHAGTYRAGDNLRSLGVSGSFASTGRYIPNAYSRETRLAADARLIGAASMVSVVSRFHGKRTGVPINPLLPTLEGNRTAADAAPQSLDMYSLGGSWQGIRSDHLTLGLTVGLDGYQLDNVSIESTPVPSSADSALRAATGGSDRASLRGNAVRQLGDPERVGGTLTFVLEQSLLRDRTDPEAGGDDGAAVPPGAEAADLDVSRWSSNFGLAAQANVSVARSLYLTAGNRFERIATSGTRNTWEMLPMLGATFVRDAGPVTAKLRASFGRGVRAASSLPMRDSRRMHPNHLLAPEQQKGVDGGVDLYFRGIASLHATRFDQLASGLVQMVTLYDTASTTAGGRDRIHYQRQNVGEIANRGWEGKATLRLGAIDFAGTVTQVDSRVRAVAAGYQGDMRAGDRMLGVPELTSSLTAGLERRRWSTSWTVARASNWINYDRLGIARRLDDGVANDDTVTGAGLRQFWIRYPGATRLRGTVQLELPRGLDLTLTGENLGGTQRGEPDNMTILPGRTITASVRASF